MLDKKIADLRTRLVMIDQTKLRALVGISSAATLKASIAVLSAEPSSHLWPNLDFETLHVAPEGAPASRHARDDFSLSRYSDELVASMQMVSPDARHYFVDNLRGSAITDSLLVAALLEAAKAKPSVILIPWGPLSAQTLGAIVPRLQHEHDVVLVVPAGNDPAQAPTLDGSSLADSMLVVGAVNGRGRIASFSSQGAKLAWAPGDGILPAQDGAAGPLRGTSFAAAVAAAMAGRLRAEFPAKKAPEIIAAMRSTAVPVDRGGPPVLNLDRAAAQLKAP